MATNKRRYWGTVTPLPAAVLAMQAKMQEDAGLEGLFAPQVYGPPFVPLAAAAAVTTRINLASGIALAFVRSPFETAMAAMDLDRISGGRFTLGLGSSVKSWSQGFFGMPYGKPLEHMREVVEILRTVIAKAHTGELTRYVGKYHQHVQRASAASAASARRPADLDRGAARPARQSGGGDRRRRHRPPDLVDPLADGEDT